MKSQIKTLLVAASVASMVGLMPALALDTAGCQASWTKMDPNKSGHITGADAQRHMDMMKKSGRTTAAADRVTDKEYMDACIAGVFDDGKK